MTRHIKIQLASGHVPLNVGYNLQVWLLGPSCCLYWCRQILCYWEVVWVYVVLVLFSLFFMAHAHVHAHTHPNGLDNLRFCLFYNWGDTVSHGTQCMAPLYNYYSTLWMTFNTKASSEEREQVPILSVVSLEPYVLHIKWAVVAFRLVGMGCFHAVLFCEGKESRTSDP